LPNATIGTKWAQRITRDAEISLLCGRHHDRVHLYDFEIETGNGGAYRVNPYRFRIRNPLVRTMRTRQ
jgi:hypothetical protein